MISRIAVACFLEISAFSAMAAAIWDLVRALDMVFWVSGAVMRVYLVANRTLITSEK